MSEALKIVGRGRKTGVVYELGMSLTISGTRVGIHSMRRDAAQWEAIWEELAQRPSSVFVQPAHVQANRMGG